MKIWNTKYALSSGITTHEVEEPNPTTPNLVVVEEANRFTLYLHGEGRDWHRTKESAVAKADDMRKRKIASLKKQIEKLEKLTWQ